tara:strand:- start:1090 stop:1362 length:273 start_codon:yes stop_codon:yes gene_type:complete
MHLGQAHRVIVRSFIPGNDAIEMFSAPALVISSYTSSDSTSKVVFLRKICKQLQLFTRIDAVDWVGFLVSPAGDISSGNVIILDQGRDVR